MRRNVVVALLATLLAIVPAANASAHANLERSDPPAGATVAVAPREVVLEFSERLDPGFTSVRLVDSTNRELNPGPGAIDPANPRTLRLTLGELPRGTYTAFWRVRSADDGHVTQGSVPFGVGVAVATTALIPPPGAPDSATAPPPPLDSVARWLTLLATTLALGGLPFALFVWRPAFRRLNARLQGNSTNEDRLRQADQGVSRFVRRLIVGGGGVLLLTCVLGLVVQASNAAGVSLSQALGNPLAQLLASRTGLLWIARSVCVLAVIVIALRLPPSGAGAAWRWWVAMGLGGGILLTFSLGGHAAALREGLALAVALDWLHLVAMVTWLGGLVPLAYVLSKQRERTEDDSRPGDSKDGSVSDGPRSSLNLRPSGLLVMVIPRFSLLAIGCVAMLSLTGVYASVQQVGAPQALAATTYGRALLVKLGLFGLLLALGAINLLILSPRLRALGDRLAGSFRRSVRIELAIGVLVLLAAGALTSVEPGRSAWETKERQGVAQPVSIGDVNLVLRVAPARIGENEFAVDVADGRPGAAAAPSKVLLRFQMDGMEMGRLQTEMITADSQRYTARGSYVSMGGRWQIEVILRRAGFDDVSHTFQLDIVRAAAQQWVVGDG